MGGYSGTPSGYMQQVRFIKVLDRINRMDRIVACRPDAGQAINHRLRRGWQSGGERRRNPQEGHWDAHENMRFYIIWKGLVDTKILEAIKKARGSDYNKNWAKQGSVWDPFVKEMWLKYRNNLPPDRDGQNSTHDNQNSHYAYGQ